MFKSARLKLTVYYLAIIMLVSASFSLAIYKGVTLEFGRSFTRIEQRLRAGEGNLRLPVGPRPLFHEDLETARQRIIFGLLSANGIILVLSAAAGYFLAGRTLGPIEKALEEQKRFVADASHELRTPLTALKTSLEVALRDKKMSAKAARDVLQSNLEDINDLQSLTNKLLTLNRSDAFANVAGVNLATIVKNVYQKILPLAKKKGVAIGLELEDMVLEGDRERLREMVVIFLDNAVKYTPRGGKVTVSTRSDKKYAFLEVKDTGMGIAKEDLPHIFDRFYRADKSRTKTGTDGFGLGLSLAKRIIEMHGGAVDVSSMVGQGTTFTIKLPL